MRTLVIDDHASVADMIGLTLEAAGGFTPVGRATGAGDGVARAAELRPELIILDVNLWGADGLVLIPRLREACPGAKILVFSGHLRLASIRRAMLAGADGIVEKAAGLDEFEEALRALRRGGAYLSRSASEEIRRLVQRPGGKPRLVRLTAHDRAVLRGLAEGRSSKEIAAELGLSRAAVANRRVRLGRKLGFSGIAPLTRYAVGLGLVPGCVEEAPEPL